MKKSNFSIVLHTVLAAMLVIVLLLPTSGMATGPRVTPSLFSPAADEIFAVDFPPFVSTGGVAGGGLHTELVEAAFHAGGTDAIVTPLPLAKMVKYYLLQEGALAALGRFVNFSEVEKKELIFIPISIVQERYFYYHSARQPAVSWKGNLQNFQGNTYGALRGDDVSHYKAAGIHIAYSASYRALLKKLLSKKVDFVRIPPLAADWLLNKYFPDEKRNVIAMDPPALELPVFLVFNKKHPKGEDIAGKFNQGLTQIIADGRYKKILARHLGNEEE